MIGYGPAGLLILALLDSAGLPVVGGVDALLIAIGASSPGSAYLAAALAVAGSLIGSSVLFFVARKGGEVFLHKQLHRRSGRKLHAWFQQYGLVTVFVPALSPIPLPMKIPVFCAGALQVRYEYFALTVAAARCARYFGLAYLSLNYGNQAFAFVRAHGWRLAGIALLVAIAAMAALRLLQKREASLGIPQ